MPRSRMFNTPESLWPPILRRAHPPPTSTVSKEVAHWKTSKIFRDPVGILSGLECNFEF